MNIQQILSEQLGAIGTQFLLGSLSNLNFNTVKQRGPLDYRADFYFRGSTDGTGTTSGTAETKHTAFANIFEPKVVYGNIYNDGPATTTPFDKNGLSDLTLGASLIYGTDQYIITFNGLSSITLKAGQIIESDTIGVQIPKGATYKIRTYINVGTGGKYPLNITTDNSSEGFVANTDNSGNATAITASLTNVFGPMAIIGDTDSTIPSVLIVGDSIARGIQDSSIGYINRALQAAGVGYVNIGRSGEKASDWKNQNRRYRIQFAKYCSVALVEYGVNDITAGATLSAVQTELLRIWGDLVARGLKVYQTTLTPKTTSTDSWATTANQTTDASNSVRVQVNNWIRTCPAPLSGYFEIADLIETSRDSGIWKAGYTPDGIHPNSTATAVMKNGIDITKLTAL